MPGRTADQHAPSRAKLALALIAAHDGAFRRTARRHSMCHDDAEDAYQRALEILLTKAPTHHPARLAAWMHTVTKHEAMAVRRARERLVGDPMATVSPGGDPLLEGLAAEGAGPAERVARRERVARSAEALATLKPQERRALALKAEGYSYAEIRILTGWTYTKVNRCMAEGRKRFLEQFARIEDRTRCEELATDLEILRRGGLDRAADALRRHLVACPPCRRLARARLTR